MSEFLYPVQLAVYNRLTTVDGSANINPAEVEPGKPLGGFPYTIIGLDQAMPWDTDDTLGARVRITLHVFSRLSSTEVKTIMQTWDGALKRQAANLNATGYRFVDVLPEFSDIFKDGDGATHHGIIRYIATIEKE